MTTALGMLAVLVALGALFATARFLRLRGTDPERSRKLVHVGMGIVALSFPWLFATPLPVDILAGAAGLGMLAVRVVPALQRRFGCVLHDVNRRSYGEFAFIAGIGIAFSIAHGDLLVYELPIAVLTFADSAASLVGGAYGSHRFRTFDGFKSLEGSAAFFVVAVACVAFPLAVFGRTDALPIAIACATLLAATETASPAGLDNVTIPVLGEILLRGALGVP